MVKLAVFALELPQGRISLALDSQSFIVAGGQVHAVVTAC